MYNKLDKKEKDLKYVLPYQNEKKIWQKNLKIFQNSKKEINNCKRPLGVYHKFKKNYYKKIKMDFPNFDDKKIVKKINELYYSKEKQNEIKQMKEKFRKKLNFDKEQKKEYEKNFKNKDLNISKDSNISEISLKKREKYKSFSSSPEKIKKLKKKQFIEKRILEKENSINLKKKIKKK